MRESRRRRVDTAPRFSIAYTPARWRYPTRSRLCTNVKKLYTQHEPVTRRRKKSRRQPDASRRRGRICRTCKQLTVSLSSTLAIFQSNKTNASFTDRDKRVQAAHEAEAHARQHLVSARSEHARLQAQLQLHPEDEEIRKQAEAAHRKMEDADRHHQVLHTQLEHRHAKAELHRSVFSGSSRPYSFC
jgi:hypothetical protein